MYKITKVLVAFIIFALFNGAFSIASAQNYAKVDTVTVDKLGDYLSKSTGNVKIVLTDWCQVDYDSTYGVINDTLTHGLNHIKESIFDQFPNLRIDLELAEMPFSKIRGTIAGKSLLSVNFPDNIEILGVWFREDDVDKEHPIQSFILSNCPNLRKLTLPDNVHKIGGIGYCPSIEELYIPDCVECIGGIVYCSSLKNLILPKFLSNAPTFRFCSSLKSICLPDSIVEDEFGLSFEGCSSLTQVVLPKSITKLGDDEYEITPIYDDGHIELPGSAFANCKSLESIDIPEGVTYIGTYSFWGCTSLKNINLPSTVTKICDHAFANCTSLECIDLPAGLKEIGDYAFEGCVKLKQINIPENVDSIGLGAFWGCKSLKNGSDSHKITVSGREMEYWSDSIIVDCYVEEIPKGAFSDFTTLKSVIIPDNVKIINQGSFVNCISLSCIELPKQGVSIISDISDCDYAYSFSNCFSLKRVDFPEKTYGWNKLYLSTMTDCLIIRGNECYIGEGDEYDDNILWGSSSYSYCENLYGSIDTYIIGCNPSINRNCKVYVKKEFIQRYKDRMAEINDLWHWNLNYEFLPLEDL